MRAGSFELGWSGGIVAGRRKPRSKLVLFRGDLYKVIGVEKIDLSLALNCSKGSVVNEFKRITTLPLQSRFLSQLDVLSDKLLKIFEKRGGQIGQRLNCIMSNMTQVDDVDLGRECLLKGLCVYLNEDPEDLLESKLKVPSNLPVQEGNKNVLILAKHVTLTPPQITLLDRGLNFIPTKGSNKNIIEQGRWDMQQYHRRLKLATYFKHKKDSDPPPFTPKSDWFPSAGTLP
ncbi:hypothetical protein F7725_027073, partial [Dissostichus mawsoni]